MKKSSEKQLKKQSRYDELFEKYQGILKTGAGTKYEMLAALVFKLLNESGVVIHDLTLIGETGTEAQIDVCIEEDGANRRILVECKDFDVSENPVGIGIVRCFWAVVEDIKPDDAIIITCNSFTKEAMEYAKAKRIKLAVLREFLETDKKGRILTIYYHLKERSWTNPDPHLVFSNQNETKWQSDLRALGIDARDFFRTDSVHINIPHQGRLILRTFLDDVLNKQPRDVAGHKKCDVPVEGYSVEVDKRGAIPIEGLYIDFDILHTDISYRSIAPKVATLILERLHEGDDIVFYGEDLKRFEIDSKSGEVKPKSKRSMKYRAEDEASRE